MRVYDCDQCGETLSAANDAELLDCIHRHMATEHPEADTEALDEKVAAGAYDATDS
jgi:predicted small metal-binding protein